MSASSLELISGLSALEKFSKECDSRDMKDAALHAYLNDTTPLTRFLIENALGKVIEVDSIQL